MEANTFSFLDAEFCINIMNSWENSHFRWRCHDLIHSNKIYNTQIYLQTVWLFASIIVNNAEKKQSNRAISHIALFLFLNKKKMYLHQIQNENARQNHLANRCSTIPLANESNLNLVKFHSFFIWLICFRCQSRFIAHFFLPFISL